jgi:large subunit ribosomal protein L18
MKDLNKEKGKLKVRRIVRVRAKVVGSDTKPRLAICKTLKHLSAQVIDDVSGKTIVCAYDKEVKAKTATEKAVALGALVAKKLLDKKIETVVFDRRHNRYHGVVKAFADGAREGGLKF